MTSGRIAVVLLAVHAALALWGAARNSVTYDENFHLPSGIAIVTRGEYRVSAVNPPLVKVLCGLAALGAGARPPAPEVLATHDQRQVGESFMRANAAHFHTIFFAGRCVVVLLSVLLGLLVWRFARRLYGPAGALLALGLYAFAPESLAHAGLVTMDLATGLGYLASVYAWWGFARSGRWRWWAWTALAVGLTALVRFTALLILPVLAALALTATLGLRVRRPGRLWVGLILLLPATLLMIQLGYLGKCSFASLAQQSFYSHGLNSLRQSMPWLRLPIPDAYLSGLDWQSFEAQVASPPTYLLGHIRTDPVWYYFPFALLFKWPLGFLGALVARAAWSPRTHRRRRRHEVFLLLPVAAYLLAGMFLVHLNVGIRYMFPILPLLCVWLGGLMPARRLAPARGPKRHRVRTALAIGLVVLQSLECLQCAPWFLSFFNLPSGGPGGGDRLVNDSNVDWGQGLIALRDELKRRGIARVHLSYHGTTDPAIYGIDYVPYIGGEPGREADWIAISSYYFVGLTQRMVTSRGTLPAVRIGFSALWKVPPVAKPAGCMYLYPVPHEEE